MLAALARRADQRAISEEPQVAIGIGAVGVPRTRSEYVENGLGPGAAAAGGWSEPEHDTRISPAERRRVVKAAVGLANHARPKRVAVGAPGELVQHIEGQRALASPWGNQLIDDAGQALVADAGRAERDLVVRGRPIEVPVGAEQQVAPGDIAGEARRIGRAEFSRLRKPANATTATRFADKAIMPPVLSTPKASLAK